MRAIRLFLACCLVLSTAAAAQQVPIGQGSIAKTVARLKPGEFVWAPEAAPSGPTLLVVNLKTQRAILYRNGVPIAATTVSTGREGYSTPTGVFTILQKRVEHYSTTYDNAPMPYMQRLTWRGVALHAGKLPGYPASHGCIRLPGEFAKLLYEVTRLGMTVAITDSEATPRIAPDPGIIAAGTVADLRHMPVEWAPARSPDGPVSIVVSAADRKAVVIRNGIVIGSASVTVDGPVEGSWIYTLREVDENGQRWLRISMGSTPSEQDVAPAEWRRFQAPPEFRKAVAEIVAPGTTVVVTEDSLHSGATGVSATVLVGDAG